MSINVCSLIWKCLAFHYQIQEIWQPWLIVHSKELMSRLSKESNRFTWFLNMYAMRTFTLEDYFYLPQGPGRGIIWSVATPDINAVPCLFVQTFLPTNLDIANGFQVTTLVCRAPELLRGDSKYSTAVDMWSVGCIFAEMVRKQTLFSATTEEVLLIQIFRCHVAYIHWLLRSNSLHR